MEGAEGKRPPRLPWADNISLTAATNKQMQSMAQMVNGAFKEAGFDWKKGSPEQLVGRRKQKHEIVYDGGAHHSESSLIIIHNSVITNLSPFCCEFNSKFVFQGVELQGYKAR